MICRLNSMMLHVPIRRVATLVLAASLAVVLVPGLAAAHADLVTPTPADKSTVTVQVAEVSGIYSEAMTPAGSSLIVKNAAGTTVAQGTVDQANNLRMVATPTTPLGSGSYTVAWTSTAIDLHVERGTWAFTIAVTATPAPTPVATAAPSTAPTPAAVSAAPTIAPTPAPVPSAGGSTTGSTSDVLLPIIVALIILIAGATYFLTRRYRPSDRA